jgi:hypothetical protein
MTKRAMIIGLAFATLLGMADIGTAARERYPGGSIRTKEHGNEHGYRDGFHRGREDRDHGIRFDFKTQDYKRADRGYEPYMGERDEFRDGYRSGYRAGYEDGYNRRPGRWDEVYGIDRDSEPYRRGRYDGDDSIYVNRHWITGTSPQISATVMGWSREKRTASITRTFARKKTTVTMMPITVITRSTVPRTNSKESTGRLSYEDMRTATVDGGR